MNNTKAPIGKLGRVALRDVWERDAFLSDQQKALFKSILSE